MLPSNMKKSNSTTTAPAGTSPATTASADSVATTSTAAPASAAASNARSNSGECGDFAAAPAVSLKCERVCLACLFPAAANACVCEILFLFVVFSWIYFSFFFICRQLQALFGSSFECQFRSLPLYNSMTVHAYYPYPVDRHLPLTPTRHT